MASGSAQEQFCEPRQAGNGATVANAACVAGKSEAASSELEAGKSNRSGPAESRIFPIIWPAPAIFFSALAENRYGVSGNR